MELMFLMLLLVIATEGAVICGILIKRLLSNSIGADTPINPLPKQKKHNPVLTAHQRALNTWRKIN